MERPQATKYMKMKTINHFGGKEKLNKPNAICKFMKERGRILGTLKFKDSRCTNSLGMMIEQPPPVAANVPVNQYAANLEQAKKATQSM